MEEVNMITENLQHIEGMKVSKGNLQQGTLHNKMEQHKGKIIPS